MPSTPLCVSALVQASQALSQAASQQTPEAQNPDAHSLPSLHAVPSADEPDPP